MSKDLSKIHETRSSKRLMQTLLNQARNKKVKKTEKKERFKNREKLQALQKFSPYHSLFHYLEPVPAI